MEVIGNQSPGIAVRTRFQNDCAKALQKIIPVKIILKNFSAFDPYQIKSINLWSVPTIYTGILGEAKY